MKDFNTIMKSVKRFFRNVGYFFTTKYIELKKALIRKKQPDAFGNSKAIEGGTVVFPGTQNITAKEADPQLTENELRGKGKESVNLFKKRTGSGSFVLQLLVTVSKVSIIAVICIGMVGLGAVLGLANAYLESTPDLDLNQITENDLTSYIYAADGTLLTTYAGLENRYYAPLEEIPDILQKAVISVEDVRFYHHKGVDFKRLLSSFIGNLTGSSSAGGSTITQQLIKNQVLTSERSYKRKIQEAYLAIQLEKEYSKEQILEAYLNTIPLGGTNYGVKAAAKDYFGKELDQLTLREVACIAGITQYPSAYSPRYVYYTLKDTTKLDNRINDVLNKMYTAGYISLEERNAAMEDTLTVVEVSTTNKMYNYPHFVEYAITDVIKHFLRSRGLEYNSTNRALIEHELRTSGYSIYTTIDSNIQNILETTIEEYDDYPGLRNSASSQIKQSDGSITIQPQAAAVIIDQHTGQIKAMVGSRNVPTVKLTNNRAVTNRMPIGSSMKPIAVYGPAFEKGYSGATVIDNLLLPIIGWDSETGYPTTSKGTLGPVTIRQAIVGSWNNVAARTLMYLTTIEDAVAQLHKFNIEDDRINADGVGLALGSSGISPLQLTSAYASIANGGTYMEPISFTKVVDSNGSVVLSATSVQEVHEAYSKSTAFMLVDILENAVRSGTGKPAKISGMTVAGKTGSVSNERGVLFAGFTPYYTSVLWIGHDNFERLEKGVSGGKTAAPLWQKYMAKIHDGLENKNILEGSYKNYDLVEAPVCPVSGLFPTDACKLDSNHPLIPDYFKKGTVPEETCTLHQIEEICSESGMICSEYCPEECRVQGAVVELPEDSEYFMLEDADEVFTYFPNLRLPKQQVTCKVHTTEWFNDYQELEDAIRDAKKAVSNANSFLSYESEDLTDEQIADIEDAINDLQRELNSETKSKDRLTLITIALNEKVANAKNKFPWGF